MNLVRAGLVWRTKTNCRLAGDHRWLVRFLGHLNCTGNRFRIVAINGNCVPARGAETGMLICGIGNRDRTIDRDVVVIPEQDQLVKLQMACERNSFLGDAFHQAAITGQHVSVVTLQVSAKLSRELLFGNSHADSIANALPKRSGRGFNPGCVTIFRVASGL